MTDLDSGNLITAIHCIDIGQAKGIYYKAIGEKI
jgi:hypothetical protein